MEDVLLRCCHLETKYAKRTDILGSIESFGKSVTMLRYTEKLDSGDIFQFYHCMEYVSTIQICWVEVFQEVPPTYDVMHLPCFIVQLVYWLIFGSPARG